MRMDGRAVRRVKTWETVSCVLALGGQVALRCVYERTGHALWAGILGAGNDSVWEQMKALFFALLLCSLPELIFSGGAFLNVLTGKAVELVLLVLSFAAFYYTYTGALGAHFDTADVLGGELLTVLCCLTGCRLMRRDGGGLATSLIGLLVIGSLGAAFVLCTLWPPEVDLFRDPKTGRYGLVTRQDEVFAGADLAGIAPSGLPALLRSCGFALERRSA